MNQILTILQDLRPGTDFLSSTDYIVDYLLDSFDIITLITKLEEEYGIQISTDDIVPENFQNAEAIANLTRKYGGMIMT